MTARGGTPMAPVTDAEYALVRKHLPEHRAAIFDGLRESGARISEATDDKHPYLRMWHRAVTIAQKEGLGRWIRVCDLRLTKLHPEWTTQGETR